MTDGPVIASIVEGHGEMSALPVLIRRLAGEVYGAYNVITPAPHRVKRNQMAIGDQLHKAAIVQSARVRAAGGVLVVADADDDCAVTLAQDLAKAARPVPVEVTVAVREFEAWFLASIESLRPHRAMRSDASYPGDPDVPRGAKEVLSARMTEPYRETLHQVSFAAQLDIGMARRSRSFQHLVACVGRLLGRQPRQ
jgi:hypothetical protein